MQHILCTSSEYLTEFGTLKAPDGLKKHHYIAHSFRNPGNILLLKNQEIYLDFDVRLNDAQEMIKCALKNMSIIKFFNYLVAEYIKNGKLVEMLKEYREAPKPMYIFYQQQKFLPNKIRLSVDFLVKKIKLGTGQTLHEKF